MKNALFIIILLILSPTTYCVNLDSILIESIGGPEAFENLQNMSSFYTRGIVTVNGQPGTFEQCFVPPDKYYMITEIGGMQMVQAYNGKTAWQVDQNGFPTKVEGHEKEELLKGFYMETYSYLFDNRIDGGKEFLGDTADESRTYYKIAFYPMNKDTIVCLFDQKTGRLKKSLSAMDQIETETIINAHQNVNQIVFPKKATTLAPIIPMTLVYEADTIIINDPIDPALFSFPRETDKDFHFPSEQDFVDIPFDYSHNQIKIKAVINGEKKVWFILDSGASKNVFNKNTVEDLNLTVISRLPAQGITGFEEVEVVSSDSISIGDLTLYNQIAGKLNLDRIQKSFADSARFGGLLGFDFLSRFPILINFEENYLRVYNPDKEVSPVDGHIIPFFFNMQIPTINGELLGYKGSFSIDLGNSLGLVLNAPFVEKHGFLDKLDDIREVNQTIGGIGGQIKARTAFAASFRMGDVLLTSLRVFLPEESIGMTGSEKLAGNIGMRVLENFNILFDYKNSRIILMDKQI